MISGDIEIMQCQSNGKVEAIICGFVDDDEVVFLQGKVGEINMVFGCGEQIASLA